MAVQPYPSTHLIHHQLSYPVIQVTRSHDLHSQYQPSLRPVPPEPHQSSRCSYTLDHPPGRNMPYHPGLPALLAPSGISVIQYILMFLTRYCKDYRSFTAGITRYSLCRDHNTHAFTTLCQARYPTPSFVPTLSILVTCQTLSFIIILPFVTPTSSTCQQLVYSLVSCQILYHFPSAPPLLIVNEAIWL